MAKNASPKRQPQRRRRRPRRPTQEQILQRPHDAIFQFAFSYPESAAEVIQLLPEAIRPRIDPDSVRLLDRHYVDRRLRHQYTDCLAEAVLDGEEPILIYFLIEHQRRSEYWMSLRVLHYKAGIWDGYLREHPEAKKLPLIVPIMVYNGKGEYVKPLDLADLIDAPAHLIEAFYHHPMQVIALESVADERLAELPQVGSTLMAMKHIDGQLPLDQIFTQINDMPDKRTRLDFSHATFQYIIAAADADPQQLEQAAATHLGEKLGGDVMTTAERLMNKGEEKGFEKGLVKTACNMFKSGLDLDTVRKYVELPLDQLQLLQRQACQ